MFRTRIDSWVGGMLAFLSSGACILVVLILCFLLLESAPALLRLGPRLITDDHWHPSADARGGTFGLLPIVAGTMAVSSGAVLVALPMGLASGIFCRFYAPRMVATGYRRLVELLAGIPSVVYGLWGLVVLAPLIARVHPPGLSLLAGIVIVALMILPTAMLVIQASLAAVPPSYLTAAAALGLGRWTTVRRVVLPAARHGMITAAVLAMARAVGETMAVVMVCGNIVQVPRSWFDPVRTLTANIALEMGYATGMHRHALFASALVLLVMALLMILSLELVQRRSRGRVPGEH